MKGILRRALLIGVVAIEPCDRDRTAPPALLPRMRAALASEDTLWVQIGAPRAYSCTADYLPHLGPAVFRMDRRTGRAALDTHHVRYLWDGERLWKDEGQRTPRLLGPDADRVVGPFLRELWAGLDHSVIEGGRARGYTLQLPFAWDDAYIIAFEVNTIDEPRSFRVLDRGTGKVAQSPWGPLEAKLRWSWRSSMHDDLDTPLSLWSRRKNTGRVNGFGDPIEEVLPLLPPYESHPLPTAPAHGSNE